MPNTTPNITKKIIQTSKSGGDSREIDERKLDELLGRNFYNVANAKRYLYSEGKLHLTFTILEIKDFKPFRTKGGEKK